MKITKYHKHTGNNCLIAYFSVEFETNLGTIFMEDMKLFMRNGHRWVIFPEKEYIDRTGEKLYSRFCGFISNTSHLEFQMDVIAAIDRYAKEGGSKEEIKQRPNEPPFQYKDSE